MVQYFYSPKPESTLFLDLPIKFDIYYMKNNFEKKKKKNLQQHVSMNMIDDHNKGNGVVSLMIAFEDQTCLRLSLLPI